MIEQFYLTLDGTLIGTTTPGQSGPESNSNEGVHHISQTLGLKPNYQKQFSVIPGYKAII